MQNNDAKYVFFCCNVRDPASERKFCGGEKTEALYEYFRSTMKAKKHLMQNECFVKVNKTGCLSQCDLGPNIVIFPENTWYKCASEQDADDIINQHFIEGKIVKRLLNIPCKK